MSCPHCCTNAASAQAQLLQAALDDENEPEEDSDNENYVSGLSDDDLDHIVGRQYLESPMMSLLIIYPSIFAFPLLSLHC